VKFLYFKKVLERAYSNFMLEKKRSMSPVVLALAVCWVKGF
jgi:hypothetical protein